MIGNYALTPMATGRLHVLEHILFLLTHIMCTVSTFSMAILSCPFQRPGQLCELFCLSGLVVLTLKLHRPQHWPKGYSIQCGTMLNRSTGGVGRGAGIAAPEGAGHRVLVVSNSTAHHSLCIFFY